MKKQKKTIVAAAVIVAVLAASYFIISALLPPKPEEQVSVYVQNVDKNTYRLLTVANPKNKYVYVILKAADDDGNTIYLFADDGIDDEYDYSQDLLRLAFDKISALEALHVVDEAPDNYAKFGLDEDNATRVTCAPADETKPSVVILIGDYSEVADGYYSQVEGQPTVYLINRAVAESFISGSLQYRNTQILPQMQEDYMNIKAIEYQSPKGESARFERVANLEDSGDKEYFSLFLMTEPYSAMTNDTELWDTTIAPLYSTLPLMVVQNRPTQEDLVKYGLDNPYIITYHLTDGESHTFRVGTVGDTTGRYVMKDGIDSVYYFSGDMSGIDSTVVELRGRMVWLHDIKKVSKLEIATPKGSYSILIDDTVNTDDHTGAFVAVFDGVYVSEENARTLYRTTISAGYTDITADQLMETTPSYVFKVTYRTGKTSKVSFYKVNARNYAVRLEDTPLEEIGFCVNVTDLREVDNALNVLLMEVDSKR